MWYYVCVNVYIKLGNVSKVEDEIDVIVDLRVEVNWLFLIDGGVFVKELLKIVELVLMVCVV